MKEKAKTKKELMLEVQELRNRLDEAEETLRAIRSGEVDGLVVMTSEGEQVFTLAGAEYPYRAMVETMNEGAVTISHDGTILYCNMRFADMLKRPIDRVIGFPFRGFIAPESRDVPDALLLREKGEKESIEGSLRAHDGTTVPVYISASSIKVDDSKAICVVVTDLSEQKRDEKLLETAKLAQSVIDISMEAIFICDENGRIVKANLSAHSYFSGKLLHQAFDSVCPLSISSPSPLEPTRFSISSVLSGKITRSLEVSYRQENTTEFHFLLSARPLINNGKSILGCVVNLVDITGRKHLEMELTRLASFPRLNPNPIVEVDLAGRVHYSNPAAEHLFPDLRTAGRDHPWLADFEKISQAPEIHSSRPYVREIRVGKSWYQQRIHAVLEGTRLRIYGFDITEPKVMEETLSQNELLLRTVLNSSPDPIFLKDRDSRVVLANPATFAVVGKPAEAVIGKTDAEFYDDPETGRAIMENDRRIMSLRRTEVVEETVHDPGGKRVFLSTKAPYYDAEGRIVGLIGVSRDITERKRGEEERELLRVEAENEKRRLEAVMEALPVGLAITDPHGGVSRYNKSFERVWGGPLPVTKSTSEYGAYKAWWSETGEPVAPEDWASAQAVQKGLAVVGQLMEIERFDGSRASIFNSGSPIFDAEGKITGCAVAIQDISDLRKAEHALRESEERLRRMIETSPVAIGFGDSAGKIFEANESFYRLTGYTREEIQASQLGWDQLTAPEYAELDRQIMATLAAAGSAGPYEKEYIRKDGSRVPLLLSVSKFPGRDEHIAFIVDITERKRNELSHKRAKERFELLAETASRLLATPNPQGVVNELCQKVMAHLDCHAFFNYLVDENLQRLHLNAWAGIPEQTAKEIEWLEYGVAVCGCAARDAARIVCENIPVTPDPRTELVKSFGIKAYACHPLFSEGRVMGTLSFGTRTRTTFTEDELSLMKSVADQVATAMERIRLLREIEKSRDELEERVLQRTEELKNANEKVNAERKLFYEVLETIPAYVVLLTPDYHATFANRTFIERFGESQGRRCFEFLFGRSEPCEVCETYTVLKTMSPHEWEWAGPDGRVYFVHDFPFTDVDGTTLILEMGIDITKRKEAEQALREASLYTRNLIEANLDPLVTISVDGKIMDVNVATEIITGVPRDELVGTDFSDYFMEPEKARDGYRQVFREGLVRDYPLAIRHRSGKVTDVLYNATVYKNQAGGVQGVFAAARDITERKRAEEELRDKESQLRFFASQCLTAQETERRRIAAELHDSIASALAGLKFRIEKTGEDIKRGVDSSESMKDLSSNLSQTIGEVRRIMTDLRPSILDDLGILPALSWFCREFEKTYSHLSVRKQIGISEEEVPAPLKTVIFRISQEAMSNIARHSKASVVDLALQKAGDRLELTIQDNGHGFQLDEIVKGFGLSTMRERAELSGGIFEIQSSKEKGTLIRASWALAR